MEALAIIPSQKDIVYSQDEARIQEIDRISQGLREACSILDHRSQSTNSWSFSPESWAASIVRWRLTAEKEGKTSQEATFLDGVIDYIADPDKLTQVTTPANFDLTVRTIQELYRTLVSGQYAENEQSLLFGLADGSINSTVFQIEHDRLYERWQSQMPIQLTEDLTEEKEVQARQRFARPPRYEAAAFPESNFLIFWDNTHLLDQFRYHVVRLYQGGNLDEIRQRKEAVEELWSWLESEEGNQFKQLKQLLQAVDKHPEQWELLCYRVWLAREVSRTANEASQGIAYTDGYYNLFERNLQEESLRRFEIARKIPKLIYLGSESLIWTRQEQAAGADLGAAVLGVRDGLTRGEMYAPLIMRIQPEARYRLREVHDPLRVWAHEFSYILTSAQLSLDYDFAKINSGPLEGILHSLRDDFDWLQFYPEIEKYLPINQIRNKPTKMTVEADFVVPREVYAHDLKRDIGGENLMVQLGLRYLVDDDGVLTEIPYIAIPEVRLPINNGLVSFESSDLSPLQIGNIKNLANLCGQLAFWRYFWEEQSTGSSEVWGEADYPGKDLLEKLEKLGLKVIYPDKEKVRKAANYEEKLKSFARGVWDV